MQKKRYTFSKCQRLLKPDEFKQVFEQQQKIYYRGVVAYYCTNNTTNPRLGLVVAKRHFKKAVTRNYIKRQMRESFRLNQSWLDNQDIILVATAKLLEKDTQCPISTLMAELWQRLATGLSPVRSSP